MPSLALKVIKKPKKLNPNHFLQLPKIILLSKLRLIHRSKLNVFKGCV